jgi:hypothetical protein
MFKVNVILADKGKQNQNMMGTLDLLNAGWANTAVRQVGPGMFLTPPMAVAIFYEADFSRGGRPINLELRLVDADGQTVEVPGPTGGQPMVIRQAVRPRVTLAPPGTPVKGNLLFELHPGLPLQPDTSYTWRVQLDGQEKNEWSASFHVAPLGDEGPTVGHPVRPEESTD